MTRELDKLIDADTAIVAKAAKIEDFGVMTAAFIDGEFVLVTDYPLGDFATFDEIEATAQELVTSGEIENRVTH